MYLLFGSVVKSCIVNALWSGHISHKKKKVSHRERRARAKAKVRKFRRRALAVALVVRCRRRPSNKPPPLVSPVSTTSEPVRWKWKERNAVGLDSVISRLDPYTLDSFCTGNHNFLRLPHLMGTLCNYDYHVKQIKSALDRVALLRGTFEMNQSTSGHLDPKTLILIWDTGGSAGLTPFRSDFIDYVECDIDVRDVTKVNKVIGIGTTVHKFVDGAGNDIYLPCVSYHLPSTDVRLFSPQVYHQLHGGDSLVNGDEVVMRVRYNGAHKTITIPIDKGGTNLPIVRDSFVSNNMKKKLAHNFRSALLATGINTALDYFANVSVHRAVSTSSSLNGIFSSFPCVGGRENENLSMPQKELLLWHWKLGIGMQRVQTMMRKRTFEDPFGRIQVHPPIIKTKFVSTASCTIPSCQSCELARAHQRSPNVKRVQPNLDAEGAITRDKLAVGDFVSTDQFVCRTPGRLPSGYGREGTRSRFNGGTIYNDAASGLIWVENQVSLGANETVMGKERFEQWMYDHACVDIKHFHGDNGIFSSEEYRADCTDKMQSQSFSGVGAQHQNSKAERAIQTIMYMARTFMVHSSLHWTDMGADDISLWPFAVKHAVWVYNRVPNRESGLTPLELITKQKADYRDILRSHVWGCPAYVLEPKLQNGQKLPKWNRRSRLGQFLGYSDEHSSLVANVRHLKTGYISPQYHVVFDDLFESVFSSGPNDAVVDAICEDLYSTSCEVYAIDEYDANDNLVYKPPPLDEVWLDAEGREQSKLELRQQRKRNEEFMRNREVEIVDLAPTPATQGGPVPGVPVPDGALISDDDDSFISLDAESEGDFGGVDNADDDDGGPGVNIPNEGAQGPNNFATDSEGRRRSTRSKTPIDRLVPGANNIKSYPETVWKYDAEGRLERFNLWTYQRSLTKLAKLNRDIFTLTLGPRLIPARALILSKKRKRIKFKEYRRNLRESGEMSLSMMTLTDGIPTVAELMNSPLAKYITLAANDCGYSGTAEELVVSYVHPLFLKAHSAASKEDNPNWKQATRGKFADEYWKAMELEIATLEAINAWDVKEYDPETMPNVIRSTWAFKCKRYPDGLIKKFKARFCARGDMQLEGVDFFETYAPVVQWTTIRLMFILEVLLGLKSKQGDVTCAFLHGALEPGETIYVDMPLGFNSKSKNGKRQVLKLNKTLYGLRQSPRAFWKYITAKLETCGLKQSTFDPCLFVGTDVMCIVYVDDLIFWSRDVANIDRVAMDLCKLGVALEQEDDAAGFLGVKLERDSSTGLLEMKQTGLIERVVEALGLDDGYARGKHTPAETKPLVKDADGAPAVEGFSYSSVVGMLLYLSGHTRPDIAYAVNCCARYMFCPMHSHELALKRIGRYLKATATRGMVINPTRELSLDAYPDADFAGMYGHEIPTDPACAKSRSGFVIVFAGVPVMWQSKLQTETALSTMEAEIIALAACMRELIPIVDMVQFLAVAVGIPPGGVNMKISVHEDNSGALVLAETLPPQFTPRSKYYATKTIWFREEIHKRGIKLLKIDTTEQLGDIFTKGLAQPAFEYLRSKIIGW